MNKNMGNIIELDYEIVNKGNWNYKNEEEPVYTKPIAVIKLDKDNFVFRHEEILKLIEIYNEVDEKSIGMIKDKKAGEITRYEIPFIDKLQRMINKLKK